MTGIWQKPLAESLNEKDFSAEQVRYLAQFSYAAQVEKAMSMFPQRKPVQLTLWDNRSLDCESSIG